MKSDTGNFFYKKLREDGEEYQRFEKILFDFQQAEEDLPISVSVCSTCT
jgi:hypothetical protein